MKLSIIITAYTLTGMALATNRQTLFVRTNGVGRQAQAPPGGNRGGSPSPPRSRASSPGGWSDTSDSSRSSVDTPRAGGRGETVVQTQGRNRITHKRQGNPSPQVIETGAAPALNRFEGPGKTRTKVQGLDDDSKAAIKMAGGKSRLTVDPRGTGRNAAVGQSRWGDRALGVVEPNEKAVERSDTSADLARIGVINGKGKIRAALTPKPIEDTHPVMEVMPGEPMRLNVNLRAGQSSFRPAGAPPPGQ